jgi:hypothetical protein
MLPVIPGMKINGGGVYVSPSLKASKTISQAVSKGVVRMSIASNKSVVKQVKLANLVFTISKIPRLKNPLSCSRFFKTCIDDEITRKA